MSEPTLIQTFNEFRLDVAEELGYTRVEGKWSAEQTLKVDKFVNDGYRRFLFSAVKDGKTHRWSFLEPTNTLVVWPTVTGTTVGAPSYSDPSSTVTASTASFYPSMVGKSFVFDTSGNSYTIVTYTSSTVIKVTGDASSEASGDTFTITADGNYRLPDNFAAINGDFHIISATYPFRRIRHRNIGFIHARRAGDSDYSGYPDFFAIAPEAMDGTAGQRQVVMLYPTPNTTITLTYNYSLLPDKLTSSAPYPKGTEEFSEAIRWACLAEAERRHQLGRGFQAEYDKELATAILRDQLNSMPDSLGYNGDPSVDGRRYPGYNSYDRTNGATVYYNGNPV